MGRGGPGGGRGGPFSRGGGRGGGGSGGGQRWGSRRPASDIERSNKTYEDYYNGLGIVPDSERESFWEAMRSDLPNSFRFTGSRSHALTVQRTLVDRYIPEITAVKYEGQMVEPPKSIPWYPDQLAWSMATPKNVIRRFPPFANFQKFLVSESSVGNITRQEIVSMIPPLMMDLKPGMTVLDMCAAPGSKSVQMMEAIHGGEEGRVRKVIASLLQNGQREGSPGQVGFADALEMQQAGEEGDYADDGRATGLLIANDREYKRAQMLIHQCKRINSPNLIVTNHDAALYPSFKLTPDHVGRQRYLKYDRILADVPCSGDGTARKNFDVWRDWQLVTGLGVHNQQTRILMRALQMLKVGGRVVYSTCSLNPIENESVVSEAIQRCGGIDNVSLLDPKDLLPGLERRPGLRDWDVKDRRGKLWDSWDAVTAARAADKNGEAAGKVTEGMFPPVPEAEIPLHRCVRVYPHLQDTGGFFIAVLEKRTEIKTRNDTDLPLPTPSIPEPSTATDAPVSAMVNEIKAQPVEEARRAEHIAVTDELLPPPVDGPSLDEGRGPPVERQNDLSPVINGVTKRTLDADDTTEEPPAKTARLDRLDLPPRIERLPLPPSIPPKDHPVTSTQPTLSEDPSQAGLKNEPTTSTPAAPGLAPAASNADFAPGKRQRDPNQPYQTESFIYLASSHPTLEAIRAFYKLSARFPNDRFLVRNPTGDPVKGIYYTSALVKEILEANEGRGVKFVHAGVKMFVKQDVGHPKDAAEYDKLDILDRGKAWRIQNEGLNIIERWVGSGRVVKLHKFSVLRTLLREMFIKVGVDGSFDAFPDDFKARLQEVSLGCCVLRCEPSEGEDTFDERHVLPLWRGHGSVNLMLPKDDRKALLLRFFSESDAELIDHSNTKSQGWGFKQPKSQRIQRDKREARDAKNRVPAENEMKLDVEDESEDDDEEGGVKLDSEGPRLPAEDTMKTAEATGGESGVLAVEAKMEEKERERDARIQARAQEDVDLMDADDGDQFNKTV